MTSFGIVVHRERPEACDLADKIEAWLRDGSHPVRVHGDDPDDLGADLDLAISVGGDGTMLRTVRLVSRYGTPVLGVNVGHLGYLTEVEPDAWQPALERFLRREHTVQNRMTLDVCHAGDEVLIALNDAVVEKVASGHTVRVAVFVADQPVISYAADAIIISTPTGSTAYNLSAGGPLVSPNLEAMLITPVAAHSLLGRPLVVAGDETVRIEVLAGEAVVGVDGRPGCRLAAGDAIECRAGRHPARLVTFGGRDFWSIVKAKFGLNGE